MSDTAQLRLCDRWQVAALVSTGVAVPVLWAFCVWAREWPAEVVYWVCLGLTLVVSLLGTRLLFPPVRAFLVHLGVTVYNLNAVLSVAFALSFYANTGDMFLPVGPHGAPDDRGFYHPYASQIAEAWRRGETTDLGRNVAKFYGYLYTVAGIYYASIELGGKISVLSPRLVNALFGALIPLVMYLLAERIFDERVARSAAILGAVFPVFYYYSSLLLRDIVVALLILACVLFFLKTMDHATGLPVAGRIISCGLLVACLAATYWMRDITAAALVVCFALYWAARRGVAAQLALGVVVLVVGIYGWQKLDVSSARVQTYLTYVHRYRELMQLTESETSLGMRYVVGAPFPVNVPLQFLYAAAMPFPPARHFSLPEIVLGAGAAVWYFLLPFWAWGMWRSRRNPESRLLSMISLVLLLGISLTAIDIRQKLQFFGLALVQVAYASQMLARRRRRSLIIAAVVWGLSVMSVAYAVLKSGVA